MENALLNSLVKKYGTPLYVYDDEKIESQYKRMLRAFKDFSDLKINYAVKALSNISILKFIKGLGAGIDTVSIGEVRLGLKAGFSPDQIIFTPNGVSFEEIETANELGVHINIDNLSILEQFGQKYPKIPVCVRINPHIMAGGHQKISVGHIDSKFGISIHQLPHIHRIIEITGMHINGVHMHTGSDIYDIESFLMATEILFNAAATFKNLEFIDFGSGFKVPYKKDDIQTDVEEFGAKLSKRFRAFEKEIGKELTIMFEPGKFLVSEAGKFLVNVNVIKQTTSNVFVQVNSGFNHLIRPMFYDAYHHIENISNPTGKERFYTVVGYICETDTFGANRRINEIKEGDTLCFSNAGAYSFTMASNYNSRLRPAEVMIYKGKDYLIRERETLDDLTRNQIITDIDQ
jgi:diaminopimelate decarboxylase